MIDDSKKLVLEDREKAYDAMIASGAVRFALGEASVAEIDSINILQATFLAMRRALQAMAEQPDLVLIDGNQVPPELGCQAETIVGGDAASYSIAAASIFAKVTRDRYMARLAESFPGYGWHTNRGYSSREHLAALRRLGPTPHHRTSFAPVRAPYGEPVEAD
jgi:ribonuclease HII